MNIVPPAIVDPLFDSLAHPTLSGDWLGRGLDASFAALDSELDRAGYAHACAIGLDGVEDYEHAAFASACMAYPRLVPIAGFNPVRDASPAALATLRAMGFRGIKVHPRFSGLTRRLGLLGPTLRAAGDAGLVVFLCTYSHCRLADYPATDPFFDLVESLRAAPATRVVLVHGGDVNLLRYAELVRHNPNLLLDLSMTLMKYAGSSLDADLRFLFSRFDERICIGTDWPEYSAQAVRARFDDLTQGVSAEKRRHAASRNLAAFLDMAPR